MSGSDDRADDITRLARFLERHPRLFVLTGAGVSTASGIPDYRDGAGNWKHPQPVQYQDFLRRPGVRRRYWARSLAGWARFAAAAPNAAHQALARLERAGFVRQLVTQNVDGLHQHAGSRRVIDLHGRLDRVDCLTCRSRFPRHAIQALLLDHNPGFAPVGAGPAPDGDAQIAGPAVEGFRVPPCPRCGGLLKPGVVFYGEGVPRPRVERARARLAEADALLVVGSSLMVFSGFRFAREAAAMGKPIAAVNLGVTRADDLFGLKVAAECGPVLEAALGALGLQAPADPAQGVRGR